MRDRVCVRVNTRAQRREVNSCAHDQSLRANIASFRMRRCQHTSDILSVRATHIWTRARTRARACPTVGARARPLAHRGTNTCYTHTVNLAPRSNAARIVPGLEDIKSLDYPIKSYSAPPHAKSPDQTTEAPREGRGKCSYSNARRCATRSGHSSQEADQYSDFDLMGHLDMKAPERTAPPRMLPCAAATDNKEQVCD